MNKQRRIAIDALIEEIQGLKDSLESVDVEAIESEEQDYFDNMPESFKDGDKGSAAEEAITNLSDAKSSLDEALSALDDAINYLGTAKGD